MKNYSDVKKVIWDNFPKSKIKSIKEFPEGYNNVAYDVRLDDGEYVIKILKIKGYEKYVLKQNKLRKLIVAKFKDFPIAKIVKSDYTRKVIDKPYVVLEKIEGKSMRESLEKINNKKEIFEEIGELYGKLHSFKMETYGELDPNLHLIKTYKSWYIENCKKVNKILNKIEERKLLSSKTLKENKVFFDTYKKLLQKEIGPRLCHGDASLTNILVKKVGDKYVVSGIIDFEFSRSGGVVHDLSSALIAPDGKAKLNEDLVSGYLKHSKLPNDLEKLIYLYGWMNTISRLSSVEEMKWRNLSEEQSIKRRKRIRKEFLTNLKKTQKNLESIS